MSAHAAILLGIAIAVAAVFCASLMRLARRRSVSAFVQLVGATGLVIVVLTHVAEAFHWLPGMGWGQAHSAGHYLDLTGAIIGLTLLPSGYLAGVLAKRALSDRAQEKSTRRDGFGS